MRLKPLIQTKLSDTESVDLEIAQLLKKGVIQTCTHEVGEFISPIFTRPKKDGSHRMILNLKSFNENVNHHHFKMDNIWSAIRLMKPGCYMASIDLKMHITRSPYAVNTKNSLDLNGKGSCTNLCVFLTASSLPSEIYKAAKASLLNFKETRSHLSCIYR